MKKLIFFLLSFCILGSVFYSCDNSKTYAEKLADERKAINKYIADHNIKVIPEEEFLKDTVTDVSKNEYVYFDTGVYMQIVDRGTEEVTDTFRNNDIVLARYVEYSIMTGDTIIDITDTSNPLGMYPEGFRLVRSGSNISGLFLLTEPGITPVLNYIYYQYYGYPVTGVMNGWLQSIQFLRDKSHVKLIIPSKMGHQYSSAAVYPYYYDVYFQRY
ncbi:MAG: DUF4827 domain-containing protein [Bacteroides sp.]|nr:DUF4827 domain-containing protein [Bacteroides sp.]